MEQTDKLASLLLGEFDADTMGWLIEGFHDYLAGEPLEPVWVLRPWHRFDNGLQWPTSEAR